MFWDPVFQRPAEGGEGSSTWHSALLSQRVGVQTSDLEGGLGFIVFRV